jgi:hypothetical protein
MRYLIVFAIITMLASAALLSRAGAQAAASTQPGMQDFTLTPMRITHLQPADYLYVSGPVEDTDVAAKKELLDRITRAIRQAKIIPISAGPLFILHGATADPTQVYTIEVGFCVPPNTEAPEGCEIRKLHDAPCAVALYVGPTGFSKSMFQSIYKLYQLVRTSGHTPTAILRERCLYSEGPDSPNNVRQLEIELNN